MSSAGEPPSTARGATSEGADEIHDSLDPATVEGLQEMVAAQAELQRQLRAGEVTQDAYDEALT
jgi:hypothetical protein